mgnify:CR=1 FL=1
MIRAEAVTLALSLLGDEDLVVFNGHVYPNATRATMGADYRQPPLVFARRNSLIALAATLPPW